MKPIFKEEQDFLTAKLGVKVEDNSWRYSGKIYLNNFDEKPYLTFRTDLKESSLWIRKYTKPTHKNYTFIEEYELIKDVLLKKEKVAITKTKEFTKKYLDANHMISISGGKDSDVMRHITLKAFKELEEEGIKVPYRTIAFNTSNESPDTYKHLKGQLDIKDIISPEVGFYKWITDKKNYFTPSRFVRNCCSTYKEGQIKKVIKEGINVAYLGMRSSESKKREFYDFDLNEAYKRQGKKADNDNVYKRFLPIVKFTDTEIWLYIIANNFKINKMYKLGFNRVGCLICPYQTDYIDFLIMHHYPTLYKRWCEILLKNHETYKIKNRLKWSEYEWIFCGKWKSGVSREYELLKLKQTEERLEELAFYKGLDVDTAKKFYDRKCSCSKTLNPTEISMFLKMFGVYKGTEDNRTYLCKTCLCKTLNLTAKEYSKKSIHFSNEGCNLF